MKKILSILLLLLWCMVVFLATARSAADMGTSLVKKEKQPRSSPPISQKGNMSDIALEETSVSHALPFPDLQVALFFLPAATPIIQLYNIHPVLVRQGRGLLILRI